VLFSSVVDIGTVESLSILWKDSSTMYCFLFQCQQNLKISSVKLSHQLISSSGEKTFLIDEEKQSLCSEEQKSLGFTEVKDGQWKTFYKKCG